MFSSKLKRSVATLGVVAGLLVTAGPASADGNEVAVEGITLVREPAHTVTCLDQDLNSVRARAQH